MSASFIDLDKSFFFYFWRTHTEPLRYTVNFSVEFYFNIKFTSKSFFRNNILQKQSTIKGEKIMKNEGTKRINSDAFFDNILSTRIRYFCHIQTV